MKGGTIMEIVTTVGKRVTLLEIADKEILNPTIITTTLTITVVIIIIVMQISNAIIVARWDICHAYVEHLPGNKIIISLEILGIIITLTLEETIITSEITIIDSTIVIILVITLEIVTSIPITMAITISTPTILTMPIEIKDLDLAIIDL